MNLRLTIFLSLVLAAANSTGLAKVSLAPAFTDHMVLQREMAVPIWGTARPGEKITVTFRKQTRTTTAGKGGTWRVKLDSLKAGGPDQLTIAGENKIGIKDVLVGEVWVGSGQSNMAGAVASYAKRDETLAKIAGTAPYPKIRLLKTGGRLEWTVADTNNVNRFSALLFAFGHRLHEELDVPVGLILGAVGGTPSGMWLSEAAFANDAACQQMVAAVAKTYDHDAALKRHAAALKKWEQTVARFKKEGKRLPRKPNAPTRPGEMVAGKLGGLYERYIRQVVGYGIRGVLWDQGESGTRVTGVDQYTLMGALISGWRNEWSQGEFPFIYIQKPSGGGAAWNYSNPVTREADKFQSLPAIAPQSSANGSYREHHIGIQAYPKTYMATASDLGPMTHPLNKWGYGQRAARVAMGATYGKVTAIYGPTYKSHSVAGNKVRIQFENIGQGLAFKNGDKLQGFAIAGKDKRFHWAEAKIDGDSVVVWSSEVKNPAAARYAWDRNHPWANLFNKDGLPALTFRTDKW